MNGKKVITKCCVCGREKTEHGWEYQSRSFDQNTVCSHGFCSSCFETELMKVKFRSAVGVDSLYR